MAGFRDMRANYRNTAAAWDMRKTSLTRSPFQVDGQALQPSAAVASTAQHGVQPDSLLIFEDPARHAVVAIDEANDQLGGLSRLDSCATCSLTRLAFPRSRRCKSVGPQPPDRRPRSTNTVTASATQPSIKNVAYFSFSFDLHLPAVPR